MGIRVSPESLDRQLTLAGCDDRRELPFHKDAAQRSAAPTPSAAASARAACVCSSWAAPISAKSSAASGTKKPSAPVRKRGSRCCKPSETSTTSILSDGGRFLAVIFQKSKIRSATGFSAGSPASQAFCAAKPWRRRNSFPPSRSNQKGSHKMLNFVGRQRVCYYINRKAGTLPIPASDLERKTRLELATSTLARWRSTR